MHAIVLMVNGARMRFWTNGAVALQLYKDVKNKVSTLEMYVGVMPDACGFVECRSAPFAKSDNNHPVCEGGREFDLHIRPADVDALIELHGAYTP